LSLSFSRRRFFAKKRRAAPRERVVPRACRSFANTIETTERKR
jgi:hypothetical protein